MDIPYYLKERNIPFEENVLLSKKTWIKTGGICSYWISPNSVGQLKEVCKFLYSNGIVFDLVGQTSNIFYHSTCNPHVIVSTVKVNNFEIVGDILNCECGVNVMRLAKECIDDGYAGFYGLIGLPGTVASAAVNNAGCFGCSISSMLVSAEILMPDGLVKTLNQDDFHYKKRSSSFKRGEIHGVVLSVRLELRKAESVEEEWKKAEETKTYRKRRQEGPAKNLGSVFSQLNRKKNLKNRIARAVSLMLGKIGIANRMFIYKRMLLGLYGYRDLTPYISEKQLNTFVWRDEDAERMFPRYKEFMGKVFGGLTQEIEERF